MSISFLVLLFSSLSWFIFYLISHKEIFFTLFFVCLIASILMYFSNHIQMRLENIQNLHSLNKKRSFIKEYESFLATKSTKGLSPEALSKLQLKSKRRKKGLKGESDPGELEVIAKKLVLSLKKGISRSKEILKQTLFICDTVLVLLFLFISVGYCRKNTSELVSHLVQVLSMAYLLEEEILLILKVYWFLFVQFPFEEGDRLLIDGIIYRVKRIELWRTTFVDNCNMIVYMANWNLLNYSLSNLSRAGPMWEPFSISVNINSLTDQRLAKLDKRMLKFFQLYERDLSRPPELSTISQFTGETARLNFVLHHGDNFGDEECRASRSKAFTFFIQAELIKMNIIISSGSDEGPSVEATPAELPIDNE
jgi:hypothetical protein